MWGAWTKVKKKNHTMMKQAVIHNYEQTAYDKYNVIRGDDVHLINIYQSKHS